MKRVIMFSGGITSWGAARRVADQHGTSDLILLFADTLVEDDDMPRFLSEASADIGVSVTRVCDGRTPEQVDRDRRWLSNQKVAQCSIELKIKPCRDWLTANTSPDDTILYVGLDFTELHRVPGITDGWRPWTVEFPLCDPPYIGKREWMDRARAAGIEPPRLYALGFQHNNCGGRCVRGGQAQWAHLREVFPERFAAAEAHEAKMREMLDADVAYLRDRQGGVVRPLPLSVLRNRIDDRNAGQQSLYDMDDWGGCGCMSEARVS